VIGYSSESQSLAVDRSYGCLCVLHVLAESIVFEYSLEVIVEVIP